MSVASVPLWWPGHFSFQSRREETFCSPCSFSGVSLPITMSRSQGRVAKFKAKISERAGTGSFREKDAWSWCYSKISLHPSNFLSCTCNHPTLSPNETHSWGVRPRSCAETAAAIATHLMLWLLELNGPHGYLMTSSTLLRAFVMTGGQRGVCVNQMQKRCYVASCPCCRLFLCCWSWSGVLWPSCHLNVFLIEVGVNATWHFLVWSSVTGESKVDRTNHRQGCYSLKVDFHIVVSEL